jgi:hypothetical protein
MGAATRQDAGNVDLVRGVIVREADAPVADAQAPLGFGSLQARGIALA